MDHCVNSAAGALRTARTVSARLSPALAVAGILALAAAAPSAWALTDFSPFATVGVEHNSNVFARSAGDPPFAANGNTQLGDTIYDYLGGADLDIAWERDRLRVNAQAEHFNFDRFSELNHTEYKGGLDFDWHLGPVLDGSFVYKQAHTMSPLQDTLADTLEIQTERTGTATFRILITPQFRFDLAPTWHQLDAPLPGFPDFSLRETGGAASLNYLGINKLTAGFKVEYTDGDYGHITGATSYHETTEGLTATYALTGLSSFDGQIGYSQRDASLINPADAAAVGGAANFDGRTNAFTGSIGLTRQLSVKTSINGRFFREVSSYTAGANNVIGTGGEAGATWSPDVKFTVNLDYRQETQSIQGALVNDPGAVNRVDHLKTVAFYVKYHIAEWLTLRPFVNYDSRSSNTADVSFNATTIGADLTAKLP
jgi:hypothetical protein